MNIRRFLQIAALSALGAVLPQLAIAQGLSPGLSPVPPPDGTPGGHDLPGIIIQIINWVLLLAALVALIYLIVGGFQYITSRGDEDQAGTAKNTILYAIIGLIVIGLAAVIVNFVVNIIGGL